MKKLIIAIIVLSYCACGEPVNPDVFGTWSAENRYYKADYQIREVGGKVVGEIIKYNDGTTRYKWEDDNPKYVFQNLKSKDGLLVDAISGASTKAENKNLELRMLHQDTIDATIFINNHPTSESWIRIK